MRIQKYIGNKPDEALLILRLALGSIFLWHGVGKYQGGVEGVGMFFASIGIPAPELMAWVVTLVETAGGAALILGLSTRLSALLLSVIMVVAILKVKLAVGLIAGPGGGVGYELDLSLLAGLLALVLQGAGKYSADRKWYRENV